MCPCNCRSLKAPFIIGEIGCNHCGKLETALKLVDMAAECGVNAVKLQVRDVENGPPEWADKIYSGSNSYGKTYLEHRRALELSIEEYQAIVDYSHSKGLQIGVSFWDTTSFAKVFPLGFDFFKVPSAMLTNDPLLQQMEYAARYRGIPVILSTGMSTLEEILHAVNDYQWPEGLLTVLLCTSCYPCENKDVHLRRLESLQKLFKGKARVGVSGHWKGIQVDIAALMMGAEVIERHITLDRTMKGTDHAASLEKAGLQKLVRDCQVVCEAIGSPELRVLPCEESSREKLRNA